MIKTCVIFCGGYGTRLGSITKKKPKPMVSIHKKPFLEHLLIQIKCRHYKIYSLNVPIKQYRLNKNIKIQSIQYCQNQEKNKTKTT